MLSFETQQLIKELSERATQSKYQSGVSWDDPGDIVILDSTSVFHCAEGRLTLESMFATFVERPFMMRARMRGESTAKGQ